MKRSRIAAISMLAAAGVVAGALVAPAAFAQSTSGSGAKQPVTFTVGVLDPLTTINPIKALNGPEYEFLSLNYDLAIRFSQQDLAPTAGPVTSWSHTPDGLTWTYTVRPGMTWQDGQPFTAKDIAFTYEFMSKNDVSAFSNYFPNTDSVTAPNDTTVIWKMSKPSMAPIYPPYVYILPQHIWGNFNVKQAKAYEHVPVIGSGPFQLVNWNKNGQNWTFQANDNYWGGKPTIQKLVFEQFDNAEAMVTALKNGDIDYAENIPATLFKTLQNNPDITTNVGAPTTFDQMSFGMVPYGQAPPGCPTCSKSTTNPALQDLRVRQAIEYAIDKKVLIDKALGGYGEMGTTIIPSGFPQWHWTPPADMQINFDIAKANQILDAAGYKRGSNGIRIDPKTNKPLVFRFYVLTSQPQEVTDAQYIQEWLKQIGISVNPQAMTQGKLVDNWYANDYDIYLWGWAPDPDPDFQLSTYTTGQCQSWSDTCFSDPQYDRLYMEQQSKADPQARKPIVQEMQQIIYQQIPEVVLYYNEDLQAYSNRWTGFVKQPQPQGFVLFQYGEWSYLTVHPKTAGSTTGSSSAVSGVVWLGVLAVIVLIIGAIVFSRRRREDIAV
jgi:peptide/nickel transport system substrate-binding protein